MEGIVCTCDEKMRIRKKKGGGGRGKGGTLTSIVSNSPGSLETVNTPVYIICREYFYNTVIM